MSSIKKTDFEENNDKMCKNCALFYGSQAYEGLCSSCFKKLQTPKKEEIQVKAMDTEAPVELIARKQTSDTIEQACEKAIQPDRKRCQNCSKKIGLLGVECKCGFIFCNKHRLPEEHSCTYDHFQEGKKKLEKQIIKVYNGKIAEI